MKTTRLAIALAALTAGAGYAFAQNDDAAPFAVAHDAAHADHLRQVERALATSQNAVQVAQAHGGPVAIAPKAMTFTGVRKGSARRALIIPKDPGDVKSLAEAEEDMNVMAHILDKAVSEDRKSGRAMGISVYGRFGWGSGTSSQNLFIEGTGAVFFLNVNYPLQPAPDKDASAETREKPANEWDTAKKEMAEPRGGGADNVFAFAADTFDHAFAWESGGSLVPYDADKVDDLKNGLIAALKNAANIRKLKSDDTVIVVVTGASALPGSQAIKSKPDGKATRPREDAIVVVDDKERAPAPARLVLRVKKSDADSFQNGKLNLDDFKKKVTVMNY